MPAPRPAKPAKLRREAGFIDIAATRLEYVRFFTAPDAVSAPNAANAANAATIVFLHEGLGSTSLWRDFPERLAALTGCPALIYSRHGYGRSSVNPASFAKDYMHREALNILPDLLRRLEIEAPILYGHSDGASIALIHASRAGRRVRGLILEAPHVFVEEVSRTGVEAARLAFRDGELRAGLARHHTDPDSTFRAWCEIWQAADFQDWDIQDCLATITAPTLLIQGAADAYGTRRQIDAIARGIAGPSRELLLPRVGHSPNREEADQVLGAAASFIADLLKSGA